MAHWTKLRWLIDQFKVNVSLFHLSHLQPCVDFTQMENSFVIYSPPCQWKVWCIFLCPQTISRVCKNSIILQLMWMEKNNGIIYTSSTIQISISWVPKSVWKDRIYVLFFCSEQITLWTFLVTSPNFPSWLGGNDWISILESSFTLTICTLTAAPALKQIWITVLMATPVEWIGPSRFSFAVIIKDGAFKGKPLGQQQPYNTQNQSQQGLHTDHT